MTNTGNDIHALSGAYAVDALSDDERSRFEQHLAECATCRGEVDSLREAAALLPTTTQATPPASLRASVLDAIATVRPLPPELPTSSASSATSAARPEPAGSSPGLDRDESQVVPLRRRRFRTMLVAAAAAVIVAGGVGVGVTQLGDNEAPPSAGPSSQPSDETQDTIEAVLAATDVRTAQPAAGAALPEGTSATVHWSEEIGRAVIVTSNMPAAEPGTVYELWFEHDEVMVPAGLMPREGDTFLLEGEVRGASGIGITVEPEGGSDEPSSDPLALFPLENA